MGMHHIDLLWAQKQNFVMSVYVEAIFPIKGVGFVYSKEI